MEATSAGGDSEGRTVDVASAPALRDRAVEHESVDERFPALGSLNDLAPLAGRRLGWPVSSRAVSQ